MKNNDSQEHKKIRGLVFAVDDSYLIPLMVLWHSLIITESIPKAVKIFILHEKSLSACSKEKLERFMRKDSREPIFFDLSGRLTDDLPLFEFDHVSKATYYRLFVSEFLPESLSSVLYMDCDLLVLRSIRNLFDIELEAPIAAVDHLSHKHSLRLWGSKGGSYFQAGVILINLSEWRSRKMVKKFSMIIGDNKYRIRWWDQDVLNIAFQEEWQRLSVWFNVSRPALKVIDSYELQNKAAIIHFDGADKPWKSDQEACEWGRAWYRAYKDALGVNFDIAGVRKFTFRRVLAYFKKKTFFGGRRLVDSSDL